MAAIPRADEPSLSVSPSPVSSPVFFPSPLPSRSALSPGSVPAPRRRGAFVRPASRPWEHPPSPSPSFSRSPPQVGAPASTGAAAAPGPVCWRCGDPDHFRDQCPLMEIGAVVRVSDVPQAAPDRAGAYRIP
ncbi:uncharacterized protein LOC127653080 [Xyrauchen texanus]|uniref:uncharacterized protein LOC127653080 n=1 Tax=Xyrauchen texanus TaxID=154827 RepID=UPI002241F025|nr:uncharacterized protein LOC127653080 [Xyrauchen texanus]